MRNYLFFKQKVSKERALAVGSPNPEARSCFQRDLQQPVVHAGPHLHCLTLRRPASHLSEFSLVSNFSDRFPPVLPLQPGLNGQFLLHSEEMSRNFKVPVADIVLLGRGKANPSWGGHQPKRSSEETSSKPACCMEAFWPAEDGLTSLDDHDEWLDSASQGITTGYSKAHLPVISHNS